MHLILTVATLTLFAACREDDQFIEISIVDTSLQPYFRTFRAEAASRGIEIDASFEEIEARIEQINDGNVVGRCWYNSHNPNEILIDAEYWQNATDLSKEYVVFHELGHCYLGRGHTEASTASGICLSIMASGTGSCHDRYGSATRDFYLDELFFAE